MKKSIYRFFLSALAVTVGLTSCLNDDMVENQKYGLINLNAKKIIEIPANAAHEVSLTILPDGASKVITIGEVRLAAENPAAEDVVVTLTKDKTSEIVGTTDPIFPLDSIEIPATVTIPKGQRSVALTATIRTAALMPEPQYLAVSISAVNNTGYIISGNFGHVKVNMKVKHRFEGRYTLTGTFTNLVPANFFHITTLEPHYTVQLQTKDGKTLQFFDEIVWEGYTYPMSNNGAYSGFGQFCPMFTFDENNNVTAVTNYYPAATNTRKCEIDPAGVNKYDPATKSFKVSYWMNQSSVVPTPPNHRIHFDETYTFVEDL